MRLKKIEKDGDKRLAREWTGVELSRGKPKAIEENCRISGRDWGMKGG